MTIPEDFKTRLKIAKKRYKKQAWMKRIKEDFLWVQPLDWAQNWWPQ